MTRLAFALVLAVSSVAAAQPKQPDAAAIKKANGHFKLGQEFFKSGQWDRAIAEYQTALDLTGEPLMVFNIALAHDRAGRTEQALAGYLQYLESNPEGPIADEARGYVAKLTPIVEKRKQDAAAEEARKAAEARRQQEAAAQQQELARQAAARQQAQLARVREAEAVERRGARLRIGGLVGVGVGALVAGFGLKKGLDAQRIEDELSNHQGAWTDAQIARDADGRSANTQLIVFTSVGAGVAITGAVLYLVGRGAQGRAERLRLTVAPSPSGVAALVRF